MRCENSEGRHGIDRKWFRNCSRQRLREEGYTALRFASGCEELSAEAFVALGDEEGRRAEAATSILADIYLMVQQLLHVLDGEQVLAVHRDDDGVPNLRHENLSVER